jgi:hypothetical protein
MVRRWLALLAASRGTAFAPIALVLAAASLIVCAPASANLTTPAQAVAWLNAQREANGIPGGITDNPEWDLACAHHVNWLKLNPSVSGIAEHTEIPGTPGYTPDGQWAGANSVLGGSFFGSSSATASLEFYNSEYPWGADNGWEWAPIHLMDLLNPSLAVSGFSPGCMVTGGTPQRPEPNPQLLTYPGASTDFIYPAEQAFEAPYTPGQFVGIPQPETTGPYLFVFGWGTGPGQIISASLLGPTGPVTIATVDDHTTGALGELGTYLAPGGALIPRKPLLPRTHYTATATFVPDATGQPLSVTWSFSTGPFTNYIMISHYPAGSGTVLFDVTSKAPHAALTLTGPRGLQAHPRLILVATSNAASIGGPDVEYNARAKLTAGTWDACVTSGGSSTDYAAVHRCETVTIAGTSAKGKRK